MPYCGICCWGVSKGKTEDSNARLVASIMHFQKLKVSYLNRNIKSFYIRKILRLQISAFLGNKRAEKLNALPFLFLVKL